MFQVSNVEKMNFKHMTMVQKLSIPVLLNNKDALIKSQTGSGKTLSYVIPIINKLMNVSIPTAIFFILCGTYDVS